jgi:hypothetical protein
MHYFGSGTQFPFKKLEASVEECGDRRPIRVVISDRDFNQNFAQDKSAADILAHAVQNSSPFVLLLHNVRPEATQEYRRLGAKVECIMDLEDFPRMAAKLAEALFADQRGNAEQLQ